MTITVPDTSDTAQEPIDRRRVLALIALADELPTPRETRFIPGDASYPAHLLALVFDSTDEASAWAMWLGATDAGLEKVGDVVLYHHTAIVWHGWKVRLDVRAGVRADPSLDADTRAQLEQVADVTATGGAR
jgi:hypothetical protein